MSADELEELKEHAEKAREDHSLAAVSLTMAVLAVCVAVVSLLGHRAHTEEVVLQSKASDQWAFYQAKSIREHEDVLFTELANVVTIHDVTGAAKVCEKYGQEAERYKHDKDEIKGEAVVHGALHLSGMDHETDHGEMLALQAELMRWVS